METKQMGGYGRDGAPGPSGLAPAERSGLDRYVPIAHWLPRYQRRWLRADAIAGLTLWGLVVPEGMAYAGIAGLQPQAGLYTLVASLLIYALLGTARHLSVQATSATAALLATSVAAAVTAAGAASDPETYAAYAAAFVLVTGAVFLAAGLARLGFITQFLSKPVMDGFVVGLAIFVTVGQVNKLFGVEKPEGNTIEKLVGILRELPQANGTTFVVGATALALLFVLPRLSRSIPGGLVVLFAAIGLSAVLDLEGAHAVEVVGSLPQGLPSVSLPDVPLTTVAQMAVTAVGVVLLAYSEALGVAHEFAEKHRYEVDADQELSAHAAVNLVSGLFGGMIASGSMSASAVKESAGARTQVANLVAWAVTLVTLLFLTPLFAPLPEAVLAALIIHALWHLITARKLAKLRHAAPVEFWFGVITLWGVLLVDVLEGMIIGLLASLLFVIYRSSRARLSSLGRVPGVPGAYSDVARHQEDVPVPGVLIVRLNAPMYYANALSVRDAVKSLVAEQDPPARALVFDAEGQDELDVTSADVIVRLVRQLRDSGLEVYFADVHAPILERGRDTGLADVIGDDNVFPTVDAAVRHAESRLTGVAETAFSQEAPTPVAPVVDRHT
jgi:high affinity sulfate transporter 1